MLRFGLIVCDEPAAPLVAKHGDYPILFRRFIQEAAGTMEIEWQIFDLFRRGELPTKFDGLDAIFITGSKWSANDPDPWIVSLIGWIRRNWIDSGVPLIGVCFGHQIIVKAFGGVILSSAAGWELGWTQVTLSDDGRRLFGKKQICIHSIHKEEIPSIPSGFITLGSSSSCLIQGMISTNQPILTLQGHPEVTSTYILDLAEYRYENGVIPENVYNHVKDTRNCIIDHPLIGESIIRFILSNKK